MSKITLEITRAENGYTVVEKEFPPEDTGSPLALHVASSQEQASTVVLKILRSHFPKKKVEATDNE